MYTCFDNNTSRTHEQNMLATVSPKRLNKPNSKIGMNAGDDSIDDCCQSSIIEQEEPWALRFAEMFRLEAAQNLLSFKEARDINDHLKQLGDQVKKQIGLEVNSDMWMLFDQYFDSILESQSQSRLKRIIENTIAGVYHFVEMGDADKSIRMMKIDEDYKELRENEYLFVLSKVYSQLRHILYMRFQQLLNLKSQSQRRFRYVSSSLCFSDDEDEDEEPESCSLPPNVIEQEIQKVNLNQILTDVLKTFSIEIGHVDGDAHLIMRKLEFIYLTLTQDNTAQQN